ncbi:MAG TPA: DUF2911 domain-containing protein [Cyclobacteriaceae bacterium]|nr:DUF2911 domain-containing protein [Cyclobacteriaceae bacterium]
MKRLPLFIFLLLTISVFAQEPAQPRSSPLEIVTGRYKDTYLKITYSRPGKKGREIFGNLVPFGQVWRTGANEATELTITKDIKFNGIDLKAGTYSVFTIPEKTTWTLILNLDLGLWGAYNYNPKMDILRMEIPVTEVTDKTIEAFTITVDQKNDKADIVLSWDRTKVIIPVQFLEPKL